MRNPIKFTEHQKQLIARFDNAYKKCPDYDLKQQLKYEISNTVIWHSGDGIIYHEFENEFHRKLNLLVFLGEINVNEVIEKTDYLIYCRSRILTWRQDYIETLERVEQMITSKNRLIQLAD